MAAERFSNHGRKTGTSKIIGIKIPAPILILSLVIYLALGTSVRIFGTFVKLFSWIELYISAMKTIINSRRSFLGKSIAFTSTVALAGFNLKAEKPIHSNLEEVYVVGPKEGFTPLIGTLVSMFQNMTHQVKTNISKFSMEQLDHQFDEEANTIGALILHIASSEKFHQVGTLENRPLNEEEMKFWGPGRKLADPSSKDIKGHEIDYYLNIMDEVRNETMAALQQKDDKWLLSPDLMFSTPDKPVNKFYRLFHACEHMANHNGQIKFLKSRLPG